MSSDSAQSEEIVAEPLTEDELALLIQGKEPTYKPRKVEIKAAEQKTERKDARGLAEIFS